MFPARILVLSKVAQRFSPRGKSQNRVTPNRGGAAVTNLF
jgi:hypothetical protein